MMSCMRLVVGGASWNLWCSCIILLRRMRRTQSNVEEDGFGTVGAEWDPVHIPTVLRASDESTLFF
jgi:hypothetical protein